MLITLRLALKSRHLKAKLLKYQGQIKRSQEELDCGLLPPAFSNGVLEGNVFTGVCSSTPGRGG